MLNEKAVDGVNDSSTAGQEQEVSQSHEIKSWKRSVLLGQFFRGPIPPPKLIAKYDKIIPNGADRILKLAEQE